MKPAFPKPKHAKKRSPSKSRMILELDKACRLRTVIERDGNVCQRCGKEHGKYDHEIGRITVIQWSHVHSRRHFNLRWEDDNSKALCERCHAWWGNNPILALDWFGKKFPDRLAAITRVLRISPSVKVLQFIKEKYAEMRQA